MPPSRDDFARWLADPVTAYVMQAFLKMAEANRAEWIRTSWDGGGCSKELLAELRTRADAYRALPEANYDSICDANGDEPHDQ